MCKTKSNQNHYGPRYTIHNDVTYPDHTHGLNACGWPEIMIGPVAFEDFICPSVIFDTIKVLENPKYEKIVQRIINGESVDLLNVYAFINLQGATRILCCRMAPDGFAGIKLAYPHNDDVDFKLGTLLLYIKKDGDYVLHDDYYEKWLIDQRAIMPPFSEKPRRKLIREDIHEISHRKQGNVDNKNSEILCCRESGIRQLSKDLNMHINTVRSIVKSRADRIVPCPQNNPFSKLRTSGS